MAYNNYFPATYPNYYYQPNFQQNVPQVQQQNVNNAQNQPMTSGIIWVQGEAGAKSYLVAPNTTVQLWDSESQTIYLKSADASGMPSIKTLDYTIRDVPQSAAQPVDMQSQINELSDKIDNIGRELKSFMKHAKEADSNE